MAVARVRRAHGTKGELYLESLTDHPEATFRPGVTLRVASDEDGAPDPLFGPLLIASARPYRAGALVVFEGLTDRDGATLLRGRDLLRAFDETEPLEPDEYFRHDLLGLEVELEGGERVGRVSGLVDLQPHDLIEVDRGGRTLLVPFARGIVIECDPDAGRIVIRPPEGLLDL